MVLAIIGLLVRAQRVVSRTVSDSGTARREMWPGNRYSWEIMTGNTNGNIWTRGRICPKRLDAEAAGITVPRGPGYGMSDPGYQGSACPGWACDGLGWKLDRVVSPSQAVLFADSTDQEIQYSHASSQDGSNYAYWKRDRENGMPAPYMRVAYRHNEGANVAFFDGHVEWRSWNRLSWQNTVEWNTTWHPYLGSGISVYSGTPKNPNWP